MIPTLFAVSFLSFIIIEAPPGDFVTTYIAELAAQGVVVNPGQIESLRIQYGIDKPFIVKYGKWVMGLLRGDLGRSLEWGRPVKKLLAERLPWTIVISLSSLVVVYGLGILIGTLSATRQYSVEDYVFTVIGFIGLAIPNFLFALILLWLVFVNTGKVAIGLFSPEFMMARWSLARVWDLLKHLWMPALIVGTAGTCGLIRTMRANLLDELQKPYVMVARSKGLGEGAVLIRFPLRIAMNPVVSTLGWILPRLINGSLLVSLVLGMPTIAPVFLNSLLNQDMFLAGSIVMVLSGLTVVGTLISDILLAWVDPRIREAV